MSTTAMQDMLAYIRSTLPMDLDWPRMLESKAEELLEKEKEHMFHSFYAGNGVWIDEDFETEFKEYYNQTYSNE